MHTASARSGCHPHVKDFINSTKLLREAEKQHRLAKKLLRLKVERIFTRIFKNLKKEHRGIPEWVQIRSCEIHEEGRKAVITVSINTDSENPATDRATREAVHSFCKNFESRSILQLMKELGNFTLRIEK